MEEKRRSRRFEVEAEILWRRAGANEDGAGPTWISRTRDLSTGGMSVGLQPGLNPGDKIEIEVRLPGNQSIYSQGRIAWIIDHERIKGWDITLCEGGIEFLNLTEYEKDLIDKFITDSLRL